MTTPQILAFGIIGLMMAVFIWDRFRYDVVACCALVWRLAQARLCAAVAAGKAE